MGMITGKQLAPLTSDRESCFDIACGVALPVYCEHRLQQASRSRQGAV